MNKLQRQKSLCMLLLQLKVIAFLFALLTLIPALPIQAAELADETAFFENNIRPILVDSCYKCHSIKKNKSKGGLFLDSRQGLMKGGDNGPAIKPGHSAESLLISAINYEDEDLQMPPDDPLTPEQMGHFETWINGGAVFPDRLIASSKNAESWWDEIEPESLLPLSSKPEEVIDHYTLQKLRIQSLIPAPPATETAWLRRITLDLAGRPPTPSERNDYLFNPSKTRKEEFVNYLSQTSCFLEQQIEEFNWLLMDGKKGKLKPYLQTALGESRAWDQIFKEIILADYSNVSSEGATEFIKDRVRDIDRLTNDVSVRFFGVNISCAQCHDHPNVTDWTQARYYGMKSFFGRTFENGGFVAEKEYGQVTYKNTQGDTLKASLQFLEGDAIKETLSNWTDEKRKSEKALLESLKKEKKPVPPPVYSRRSRLVEAGLAEGQAGYLARAIVNRLWHRLMGTGLVEPLDQMHGDNDPSHPELLQWLSLWFIEHDYNLNGLIRGIVLSQAYQRSSAWESAERPAKHLYAVANIRVLTPRQYATALLMGVTSPSDWQNNPDPSSPQHEESLKKAFKDLSKVRSWFERPTETFHFSVEEALQLSNGEEVQSILFDSSAVGLLNTLTEERDLDHCIQQAYLHIYHRTPTEEEAQLLKSFLNVGKETFPTQLKSMVWALLTSPESRLNH